MEGVMDATPDYAQLAVQHANEAERLLAKRLGWINDTINAQVHATLALYYGAEAARQQALQAH
jgi:hypothetical protein